MSTFAIPRGPWPRVNEPGRFALAAYRVEELDPPEGFDLLRGMPWLWTTDGRRAHRAQLPATSAPGLYDEAGAPFTGDPGVALKWAMLRPRDTKRVEIGKGVRKALVDAAKPLRGRAREFARFRFRCDRERVRVVDFHEETDDNEAPRWRTLVDSVEPYVVELCIGFSVKYVVDAIEFCGGRAEGDRSLWFDFTKASHPAVFVSNDGRREALVMPVLIG